MDLGYSVCRALMDLPSYDRITSLMEEALYVFTFDSLIEGKLGLSPSYGTFLAEAAAYCLYKNDHHSPRDLLLIVKKTITTRLVWTEVGPELDSTWADLKEATEYGAYAVGIVVCLRITSSTRVERCAQEGTGIDLWVTDSVPDDKGIFQRCSRLEVSGILHDDQNRIKSRQRQKTTQTKRSDDTGLPAYVAIVEFGSPEIRVKKRGRRKRQ
jgi:hypothetical protein